PLDHVGHQHYAGLDVGALAVFRPFARLVSALHTLIDEGGDIHHYLFAFAIDLHLGLDRYSVVDPGVAQPVAQLPADDAEQFPLAGRQDAAGSPGVVGDGVHEVDIAAERRVGNTAAAVQFAISRDHAAHHRHGF